MSFQTKGLRVHRGFGESARSWMRTNRNAVLFAAMMVIVVMLPAFEDTTAGEVWFAVVNTLIAVVAVAACGSSRRLFWLSVGLTIPAMALRVAAFVDERPFWLMWSWVCCAGVLTVTFIRLMGEMFDATTSVRNKLFACATNYLVIGLLWCYLYAIAVELSPDCFTGLSTRRSLHAADMAYFSFNIVTSVALTPAMPVSKTAQMLVILQEFVSVLYMAFVISRLVGLNDPGTPADATAGEPSKEAEIRG